jgi:hypothetical protein
LLKYKVQLFKTFLRNNFLFLEIDLINKNIENFDELKKFEFNVRFKSKELRPICIESFRPGLNLKPGLKPENGFKSYVYLKT